MVDVVIESLSTMHHKLEHVLREAAVTSVGIFVWKEVSDLGDAGYSEALAYVCGNGGWIALVPSLESGPEQLQVVRINFEPDQDNSGFVGWLATLLKTELGADITVVCGYDSANGGVFDYWCVPISVADAALTLLDEWQRTGPPGWHGQIESSSLEPHGRPWLPWDCPEFG